MNTSTLNAADLLRSAIRAPGSSAWHVLVDLDSRRHDELIEAVSVVADEVLGRSWANGWQPSELVWQARRLAGAGPGSLAVPAVAGALAGFNEDELHPRWREQRDELLEMGEGDMWPGGVVRAFGMDRVVEMLSAVSGLPAIEVLLPVPGRSDLPVRFVEFSEGSASSADQKAMAKVRALLAKAESTEFGPESEALTAKAHDLMSRHALEGMMTTGVGSGSQAVAMRVLVDDPYAAAKRILVSVLASSSRCRAVVLGNLNMVTVIGRPADVASVDLLYTSLLIQAQQGLDVLGRAAGSGSRERSRGFRGSFYTGFAHRIGDRLDEAALDTVADLNESGGGALVPMLEADQAALDAEVDAVYPHLRVVRGPSIRDGLGYVSGQDAANRASLPWDELNG